MSSLRAVIWDFDGVIVDTERLHLGGFRHALTAHGIDVAEEDYFSRYVGFDDRDAFRAIFSDAGRQSDADAATVARLTEEKAEAFAALVRERVVVYDGVRELLTDLCDDSRGAERPRLAIGSGALVRDIELALSVTGLGGFFDTIVAADHVERSKPHPATYLEACRRLGETVEGLNSQECLVIEDTCAGLASATAAQMWTLAVTNTYPAADLDADLVVDSLSNVSWETCCAVVSGVS